MKILIITLLLLTLNRSHDYPQTFVVTEVNQAADTITLQDFSGNIWTWEGAEDWMEGDTAAAIMNDNGTAEIYDDTIKQLQYTGYIY